MTDASANVVASYGYDVFGYPTDANNESLAYTTKGQDATGLYYFNARYYDASLGRFISEDPAKDGGNWYQFCRNNSLKYVEPTGLRTVINGDGVVTSVIKDDDLGFYQMDAEGVLTRIGESYFWDTFASGAQIHVGLDKTEEFDNLALEAAKLPMVYVGLGL